MDRKSTPSDQPSTSSGYSSEVSNRQPYVAEIDRIVQKFLKARGEYEGEYIELGATLSDETIQLAIDNLEGALNNVSVADLPEDYKYFLNKYGSIYGSGIDMCGTAPEYDDGRRALSIESKQRGFKNYLRGYSDIGKVEIRSCWLIAEIDEGNTFYINTSESGQGRIYMLDEAKRSTYYAKDFTEFLEKFFIIFDETKDQ